MNAANISFSEYQEAERAKQQYQRFADVLESQGFEGDALAHRALADGIRPNFSKAIREKKTSDFGLSKLNENMLNVFAQERKNDAIAQRQQNQIDAVNARTEFGAQNRQASSFANSALQSARGFESQAATARRNAARARGNGEEAEALQFDEEANQLERQAESARQEAGRYRSSAPSTIGEDGTFTSRATGYFPVDPGDPNYQMQGGRVGAARWHDQDVPQERLYTLEDYQEGNAPYVSVAMDNTRNNPLGYGTMLESEQFPGVPFRVMDTGSAFNGNTNRFGPAKGTSRIDIARRDRSGAYSAQNNRDIQFRVTQQAGQPAGTPFTNSRLENMRQSALSSGLVRDNPERMDIIQRSQSVKEINDLLKQWEGEVQLDFAAKRDERADRSELRADQRARNQARTAASTFSDLGAAQAEAARISPQLEANQFPRITGSSGAWKVGIGYVSGQEVYEAADGARIIIDGNTVLRNSGDGWEVTNLTPTDARRALRNTGQYNPVPNTQAAIPPAVPTAESPVSLPTQQPLTPQQRAGNLMDGWLKNAAPSR